ncbi:NAD(P)-binding protein [Agrocybe pediades]|nr:NAD(P)-binding protein [Agrocybe pediades]
MTYSVLLIGATGDVGSKIAAKLAKYKGQLKRVAFLTSTAKSTPEKEAKYAEVPIERVVGDFEDPETYRGFDIVICAIHDAFVLEQIKYFDAAFAAGVKHVYPTEFGADLTHPVVSKEPYAVGKIEARKQLEERARKDQSIGYTYVITGMFSDFILRPHVNVLGLSEDRRSAKFLGAPDAVLTTTHTEDIGEFTVLSTLPSHLKSLNERRMLAVEGSTHKISEYFGAVSCYLGHPIDVEYLSRESSYVYEEEQKALGNQEAVRYNSVLRTVGFGACVLKDVANSSYPEFKPRTWEETVKQML